MTKELFELGVSSTAAYRCEVCGAGLCLVCALEHLKVGTHRPRLTLLLSKSNVEMLQKDYLVLNICDNLLPTSTN